MGINKIMSLQESIKKTYKANVADARLNRVTGSPGVQRNLPVKTHTFKSSLNEFGYSSQGVNRAVSKINYSGVTMSEDKKGSRLLTAAHDN